MRKTIIPIVVFVFITHCLLSQDIITTKNPRIDNKFGINFIMGGPSVISSLSLDYFITPDINIEVGAGLVGLYGGLKYHLKGKSDDKNWTPFAGIFGIYVLTEWDIWGGNDVYSGGLYLPVGIQYTSNKGFTFGSEVAALIIARKNQLDLPVWWAIKLGYHF